MGRSLAAVIDRVTRWALRLAGLALAAMAAVALYQIVARFLLQAPSVWSEVTTRSLMIWMVYLAIPVAFAQGALVAFDALFKLSRGGLRVVLQSYVSLASLILLWILAWHGAHLVDRVSGQNLAGLDISIAWVYAAIPVGAVLSIGAVVVHYLRTVAAWRAGTLDRTESEAAP